MKRLAGWVVRGLGESWNDRFIGCDRYQEKPEGGRMNQVIESEPGLLNWAEGVEPNEGVPLMLTEKGERANEQNEVGES